MKGARISRLFCVIYLVYFGAYCIFSSFIVPYLIGLGYSAVYCGTVTSLSLLVSLLFQPVAGYLTDAKITMRLYLTVTAFAVGAMALTGGGAVKYPAGCLIFCVALAALSYPFGQLLDAWVDAAHQCYPQVVYSRARAFGSLGYAAMSLLYGRLVSRVGYASYFPVQAAAFLMIIPLLWLLPEFSPHRAKEDRPRDNISFGQAMSLLFHNEKYRALLVLFTLYWLSHRPVGSYFSLIVQQRGGSDELYGLVCGIGAAAECVTLLVLARYKHSISVRKALPALLLAGLLRPAILLAFSDGWAMMAAQVIQSVAFAVYYTVSVSAFSKTADKRLHNVSVAAGLTVSSVVGTVTANLLGGFLCDKIGTKSVILLSLAICTCNLVFYFLYARKKLL